MFPVPQVVSNEARARSQRMTEAAAARIAELEDQVERQQRALRSVLAVWHDAVATSHLHMLLHPSNA